jgi:hypothetical protein
VRWRLRLVRGSATAAAWPPEHCFLTSFLTFLFLTLGPNGGEWSVIFMLRSLHHGARWDSVDVMTKKQLVSLPGLEPRSSRPEPISLLTNQSLAQTVLLQGSYKYNLYSGKSVIKFKMDFGLVSLTLYLLQLFTEAYHILLYFLFRVRARDESTLTSIHFVSPPYHSFTDCPSL